ATATNSAAMAASALDLENARKQIASLQSQVDVRVLENQALENRLRQLQSAPATAAPVSSHSDSAAKIRELTQERDDLLAKLSAANKEIYGAKKQSAAARIGNLTDQLNVLRARLVVDEAQAVPYTPDELALFKKSAPRLADPNAEKKSIRDLPAGSSVLVAEAQNYFVAGQYDEAKDDYLKILRHDENNGLVLANLATIEMEQGKLADAEKHIKAALTQNPNDAYNLSTLGKIQFTQGDYDDALNALSRAAKLDPRNPEIENYLGVTLGHMGLRAQAETALRKALEIDPNYAPAHNNLAVIYINQQPPLADLARWHYQKAIADGQPRNPDLEKALAANGAPVNL
ncbi:MAG: tetratricopeptide repeat protein, partial [Limisphaerales bacterium]